MGDKKPYEYKIKGDKLVFVIDVSSMDDEQVKSLIESIKTAIDYEFRLVYVKRVLQNS